MARGLPGRVSRVQHGRVQEVSGFRRTARQVGEQARRAALDRAAFARPLRRCELERCRATCCHDGVVVGEEEELVIGEVLAERAGAVVGWLGEGELFVGETGRRKTAARPAAAGQLAADFPAHFARTRCVFLDKRHRCVLQRLSLAAGRHPWFWKPVSCWLHPLQLRPPATPAGLPLLTVPAPDEDPLRFVSCTHCGRPEPGGSPAREVLAAELQMLQALAGRDFAGELAAGHGQP